MGGNLYHLYVFVLFGTVFRFEFGFDVIGSYRTQGLSYCCFVVVVVDVVSVM